MPTLETRCFLLDARDAASSCLGRELTDAEWAETYPLATQKLSSMIGRYGDGGGQRRQPWYFGKLVQEHLMLKTISAYCVAKSAQKKTASEEDGLLTTTNITPATIQCQS